MVCQLIPCKPGWPPSLCVLLGTDLKGFDLVKTLAWRNSKAFALNVTLILDRVNISLCRTGKPGRHRYY